MSTNVQKLMRECLATWEHGYISTPIDLCGKSGKLLEWKEYVERHPVHYGARFASDIAIIKPLLREHAPELLIKDEFGRTLLDDPCDALPTIYESMYGKVPKHTPAVSVLRACEKALGFLGDADWEERMAAVELLNELRKKLVRG